MCTQTGDDLVEIEFSVRVPLASFSYTLGISLVGVIKEKLDFEEMYLLRRADLFTYLDMLGILRN